MPNCLPKIKPNETPMITGWNKFSIEKSAKDTPAFKKLNSGIIKKFTQFFKA